MRSLIRRNRVWRSELGRMTFPSHAIVLREQLPAPGDHLGGVLEASVGHFCAGQHAGDFVGAGTVVEDADAGLRAAVLLAFFDGEMLVGEGGDLREVGNAEDLLGAGESFELLADGFSRAASDADVDLVENQGPGGGVGLSGLG